MNRAPAYEEDPLKKKINLKNYEGLDKKAIESIKSELLNSKLFIENKALEIDKYVALTMYLTKSEWFLDIDNYTGDNNIFTSYYIIESFD